MVRPAKKPHAPEWGHYNVVMQDTRGNPTRMSCKHCSWLGAAHATRLSQHFHRNHKNVNVQVVDADAEQAPGAQQKLPWTDRLLTSKEKNETDRLIAVWQITNSISTGSLVSEEFRNIIYSLRRDYKSPGKDRLKSEALAMFTQTKEKVEKQLKEMKVCSTTLWHHSFNFAFHSL
jgi:hypothetical protein